MMTRSLAPAAHHYRGPNQVPPIIQEPSSRFWWTDKERKRVLGLKQPHMIIELRKRFIARLRPFLSLADDHLPWNSLPYLCATNAIQITGIPDSCPFPGYDSSTRGVSGVPVRFVKLYLKYLPDEQTQGIVCRRMEGEERRREWGYSLTYYC